MTEVKHFATHSYEFLLDSLENDETFKDIQKRTRYFYQNSQHVIILLAEQNLPGYKETDTELIDVGFDENTFGSFDELDGRMPSEMQNHLGISLWHLESRTDDDDYLLGICLTIDHLSEYSDLELFVDELQKTVELNKELEKKRIKS